MVWDSNPWLLEYNLMHILCTTSDTPLQLPLQLPSECVVAFNLKISWSPAISPTEIMHVCYLHKLACLC